MTWRERLYRFRSFWIFPPTAFLLIYFGLKAEPGSRPGHLLWLGLIGLFVWTLLEYGLHRFLFHIRFPIRNRVLHNIINSSHLQHHATPRDPDIVLVKPLFGLVVSAVLFGILYLISRSLFASAGVMAGVWTGFLYYEAVHYRVHFSLSSSGLIARQRRAHFHHHFTNNKQSFGVTSPLWDFVFGTTRQ